MDVGFIVGQLILGLSIGFILGIVSFGLSITFGLMRILNMAHGLLYAIGAYLTFQALASTGNFWLSLLLVIPAGLLLGLLFEVTLMRPLYGQDEILTLIATGALLYIGIDFIKLFWGVEPKPVGDPMPLLLKFGGIEVPLYRFFVIAASSIIFILVWIFFNKTMIGKVIIAALEDREGVESLGINVKRVFTVTFMVGSLLAAIGGWLHAPLTAVYHQMPMDMILYAFAVVVVGGLGSLKGTVIGGVILGEAVALAGTFYAPISGIMPFIVMTIVLVVKPEGLFGERT